VRLAELVGCLALATDLGMGQPLEHCFRTCLLAVGVGTQLGLSEEQLGDAYYITLLRFAGCNSHAHQDATEVGDEIAFRTGIAPILSGEPSEYLRFMLQHLGEGLPRATRAKLIARALAGGSKGARETIAATCEVAQLIAARLGLGERMVAALGYTFERHDGKGLPRGAGGDEIPLAAHVSMVARDLEALYRLGGRELVTEVASKRRGRAYSPMVIDGFLEHAWPLLEGMDIETGWDAVLAADPLPDRRLTGTRLGEALRCLGDFSDMKTRFTHGYSSAVADLAVRAGHAAGVEGAHAAALGAAAFVQELGMTGVPNAVLEKSGPLTDGERERIRLHPYFTERVLARCASLSESGALASTHHERIDGSGYHRGLKGSELSLPARLLAVAGAYVAMTSERPWRPALTPQQAAAPLREEVQAGRLEPDATNAVLAAAGQRPVAAPKTRPAGLTDREVEVLSLISEGKSNRQIAQQLVISPKTVGRHVENIYSKIGVSTRAGATVFALQHDLASPPPPK
jgi:HD-GYP domain-containing protein (c-di-GMP phosphodiesterase class II)